MKSVVIAITFLVAIAEPVRGQTTALFLDSQAGDWVGGGERHTYTPADAAFSVFQSARGGARLSVIAPDFQFWWYLEFSAAGDVPLVAGEYFGALRSPFTRGNGLDVSGSGRGCNTLTGRFVVHEVAYDPAGLVTRFAADFEQHCEDGVPALFGAIRHNSAISNLTPFGGQYPSYAVTLAPTPGGTVRADGLACGTGGMSCHRSLPAAARLVLRATPDPGYQFAGWRGACHGGLSISLHVNTRQTCAADFAPIDNTARTLFYFQSRRGDYVGAGRTEVFSAANAVWTALPASAPNTIRLWLESRDDTSGSWWHLDVWSPTGTVLTTGYYANAGSSPTATSPAISFAGNGRGCGGQAGSFLISQLELNLDRSIRALAIDFEQRCSPPGQPPLIGSLRFNSHVPLRPSLALDLSGPAPGLVTFSSGPSCGSDCAVPQAPGTVVTLAPAPVAGSVFSGWAGDSDCADGTVTVNGPITCEAVFGLPQRLIRPVRWVPLPCPGVCGGGNAIPDLLAQRDTGAVSIAQDIAGTPAATVTLFGGTTIWRVVGAADFNGDGTVDIVWQHPDGDVLVWHMLGSYSAAYQPAFLHRGATAWQVAAVADMNRDGHPDLVWQSPEGRVLIWTMQGTTRTGAPWIYSGTTVWRVKDAADFDGDGFPDLLWQHPGGPVLVWRMRNEVMRSAAFVHATATAWRVLAAGDVDGNGTVDVVWQGPTGRIVVWFLSDTAMTHARYLTPDGSSWRLTSMTP